MLLWPEMLKLKSKKTKLFQVPEMYFRTKHKNYYFKCINNKKTNFKVPDGLLF